MPMPTPTYEFMFAETCVLWDTQDYPLPPGLDLLDLQRSIEPALSEKGLHGEVSITPYVAYNGSLNDYCVYKLCIVDQGKRDARLGMLAVDVLRIAMRRRVRPLNLMLILGDISGHMRLLEAIQALNSRFRANVILTQPPPEEASGQLLDTQWLCKSLSAGEKLINQIEQILIEREYRPQQFSLDHLLASKRKGEVLGTVKESTSITLSHTNLVETRIKGKARDIHEAGDSLILTMGAFDTNLASIPFPFNDQALKETSLWWFNNTQHITPNAILSCPDRNVVMAKKCSVFPVEFVVRGYMTGSSATSLWTGYKKGVRNYCGNALPDGLVKNHKLPANILTPTTTADDHDVPITPNEIVERGLMTQAEFDEASTKALCLFEFGQRVAKEHGLILADTKYEFGRGSDGSILLTDEIHTLDSSRYWLAGSYGDRFQEGLEPENVDKEFLRAWFEENCNLYEGKNEVLATAPAEVVTELAWRYFWSDETITGSGTST